MNLPVNPPVAPMLAKAVPDVPTAGSYAFEPKWDGFRCIVFKDGDEIELGSRNERPLTRYFPELIESLRQNLPQRCVLDGEIVIATDDGLNFDLLQQRVHPAESRVRMLSEKIPASYVAFDLLAIDNADLRDEPFGERRMKLQDALAEAKAPIHITPLTTVHETAVQWFKDFEGAGLDGVVAKDVSLVYQENKRVMLKIKHKRSADCVVAGFRWHKTGGIVGSLLLGLYDDDNVLHHVGITSSFTMARRKGLVDEIAPFRMESLEGHPWQSWAQQDNHEPQRKPGAVSRWNAKKDLGWEPLRPDRVVEVSYDQLQGNRFRHATTFQRWRDDRDPLSCSYSQLETATPMELKNIFS